MTDTQEVTTTAVQANVKPAELEQLLHNLLTVAAKDRVRPILCSVNVTVADGSIIGEATDSYMLIRQEIGTDHEGVGTFLVTRECAEAMLKMVKGLKCGPDYRVGLTFTDQQVTLELVGQSGTWPLLTYSDFPNTATLWAGAEGPCEIPEGIALTGANLAKVGKLVGPSKAVTVEWTFRTSLKPATFSIGSSIRGLVMPVRTK